jgi:hypothetical protein
MRIDRSDPTDGPGDAPVARRTRPTPDDPDAVASKDKGTAVSGGDPLDSSPASPDIALRMAYQAKVVAVYRQYAIDSYALVEKLEQERVTSAIPRIEGEDQERHLAGIENHLKGNGPLVEAANLNKGEILHVTDSGESGDVPDDPRNYSNPKTGRLDASWSTYDQAIAAAREHTGGDLGPDSIKMYDYHAETGEGTGTLIGEQTPDRLRGWRIDSQDGHVNWWDWTGGKKGAGGAYGHDWFPEDATTPGSRYIGWAPWQDSDGNIREGN